MTKFDVSERVACRVLGQHRSTQRKAPRGRADDAALTADVVALATQYGRYGYRRITAMLHAAGWAVNVKRVERIWRLEGLRVPGKQPKKGRLWLTDGSSVRLRPERPNHVWSYDFVEDRTHDGLTIFYASDIDNAGYRLCYPRTHVPPPGLELTYVEHGERRLLVGPALTNEPTAHEAIAHAVNLFLEFTGECELIQDDLSRFSRIETRRVAWRLLPPGAHPWATVSAHLHSMLKRVSPNTRRVIEDRQATIMSHSPSEQYVGLGGFEDYIAYVFRKRDVVVLESIRRDNAIYVFGQEWERFAQLSKREVLLHRHQLARIVHAGDWKERLARLLEDRAAA